MTGRLAKLERQASPEAVQLAARLLESDIATRAWVEQVGYSLTPADVAELLGRSERSVSEDGGLLRLRRSDGRLAYPTFQFDGPRQVPGVAQVVRALDGVLQPRAIAAWLTGIQPALDGRRPIDALRDGDIDAVVTLARRLCGQSRQLGAHGPSLI